MISKVRVVSTVILGLLAAALVTRNSEAAWLMIPFVAYLLVGVLQAPDRTRIKLTAGRKVRQTRDGGKVDVATTVSLKNESSLPLCVWMGEAVVPEAEITGGDLAQHVYLSPEETAEMEYNFVAARGNFSWEKINLRVSDPF